MYTKSRIYYHKTKSRSLPYLSSGLEGFRKSRSLNNGGSIFDTLSSRKIRINWAHRLF